VVLHQIWPVPLPVGGFIFICKLGKIFLKKKVNINTHFFLIKIFYFSYDLTKKRIAGGDKISKLSPLQHLAASAEAGIK
jgi:hypothetical protein